MHGAGRRAACSACRCRCRLSRSRCGACRPRPDPARGSLPRSFRLKASPGLPVRPGGEKPLRTQPPAWWRLQPNTASRPAARRLATAPLDGQDGREDRRARGGGDKFFLGGGGAIGIVASKRATYIVVWVTVRCLLTRKATFNNGPKAGICRSGRNLNCASQFSLARVLPRGILTQRWRLCFAKKIFHMPPRQRTR